MTDANWPPPGSTPPWGPPQSPPAETPQSWYPPPAAPPGAPGPGWGPPQGQPAWPQGQPAWPSGGTQPGWGPPGWGTPGRGGGATGGGRFGRGLRLVGQSFRIIRQEPGLIVIAFVAAVVNLAIFGVGILTLVSLNHHVVAAAGSNGSAAHYSPAQYGVGIAMGIMMTIVSILATATIVVRVVSLLRGQPVTNRRALGMALTKAPHLIAYAVLSYLVRIILNNIGRRGIFGAVVGVGMRIAWSLATFFAVPIIVFEDVGPFAAVKRSAHLCRQRWGEEVVGKGAFGLLSLAGLLVCVAVGFLLGMVFVPLGVVVGVLGFVAMMLVLNVASATFQAALYLYATTGHVPGGFNEGDLAAAFGPRRQRASMFG